jgi:hypothetical protein
MATVAERANRRAARTEAFTLWANARPKSSKHVCAIGTTIKGEFTFDLIKNLPHNFSQDDKDCKPSPAALDFSVAMHVEDGDTANLNAFTLQFSTGPLSAVRVRQFLNDQLLLVYQGYAGWETAFPAFSQEKASGIGIKHERKPLTKEVAEISSHLAWNPQRFWTQVPSLATWLLNLGGLVTLDTKVTDGSGRLLAHLLTSTKTLGTQLRLPVAKQGIMPGWINKEFPDDQNATHQPLTPESDFAINVSHTVTIGFKGLNIVVNDLAFTGAITQTDDRIQYDGKFKGIGAVEVSGEYKGLGSLGMTEMIHSMIVEAVEKEVATIQKGNNGKGWLVHASLAPSDDGTFNIFSLSMELESPVHITELMRYEAGEGNEVMPDKAASFEFKNYADSVFDALVADSHRFDCRDLGND